MRLASIEIRNFRAVRSLTLPLDPELTVFHGRNANGKTSILAAIAVGLGIIPSILTGRGGMNFRKSKDIRAGETTAYVRLQTLDGLEWARAASQVGGLLALHSARFPGMKELREALTVLAEDLKEGREVTLPIFAFYDTD
ncbi:MAG: AAA family ATPase, partial [Acetobacteraceae bacterium]